MIRYCDVDWVGDHEDKRSTIGFIFVENNRIRGEIAH
jgi:hypothetical protein